MSDLPFAHAAGCSISPVCPSASAEPLVFCRLMSSVLKDLLWNICLCYLDNIVIYAKKPQELLERLRTVLDRLHQVGLKVKPSKCNLFKTEIKFLGLLG